ncbi:MAG: oligosaccharide flippase family protein [Actinobacteria bacterium]|nr:oligosaccharide flippase family protein [Actinomycetota bacterium]
MSRSAGRRAPGAESVARGIVSLAASQVVFILCGYIFYVYLARKLGPADYGLFGFVFTVLVWLELLTCGARDVLIRHLNAFPGSLPLVRRPFLLAQAYMSLGFTALAYLAALPLAFTHTRYGSLFFIAFLDLPLMGVYQLYVGYLNAFRLYTRQAVAVAVYSVAKAAGIILFVQLGYGVGGALFGNIFSTILAFLAAYVFFLPAGKRVYSAGDAGPPAPEAGARPALSTIVRSSFLFVLVPLFYNLLMSMDIWVVNLVVGGEAVGFYVAASTAAKSVFFLFSAFYLTLFPVAVSSFRGEDTGKMQRIFTLSSYIFFCIAFPASLLLSLNAGEVTMLVYGAAYQRTGNIIRVLALAHFLLALNVYLLYLLFASGRQRQAVRVIVLTITLGVAAIYLLTAWKGQTGAACGAALTTLAGTALSYHDLRRGTGLSWPMKRICGNVLLSLLCFLPLAFLPKSEANFIPLSLLFSLIYYLALRHMGFLEDFTRVMRWGTRARR